MASEVKTRDDGDRLSQKQAIPHFARVEGQFAGGKKKKNKTPERFNLGFARFRTNTTEQGAGGHGTEKMLMLRAFT